MCPDRLEFVSKVFVPACGWLLSVSKELDLVSMHT